ncbi:MAG: leucine-rich repeat domain-containing protein [Spirochaetaceae bacterium]|jgi:hypothetical protein|nr:leucine-rich repeat domain-containing protein [Spirochaetaceae bacterium]
MDNITHSKRKAAGAALAALGIFAVLAACQNIYSPSPKETGSVTISLGFGDAVAPPQAALSAPGGALPGVARTIHPDLGEAAEVFTKYVISFAAISGGAAHADITVEPGATPEPVILAVGTYTITITAYTGTDPDFVAAAKGDAGVTVVQGENTEAAITLEPVSGGADGVFSYDITVPDAAETATITITNQDGTEVITTPPTPLDLTEGGAGQKTGTINLPPGYYIVRISLTKGSEGAGYREVLHIYSGLTSALTDVFTAEDFAELTAVNSGGDLTALIPAPVAGEAPVTSFSAAQYTAAVVWAPTGGGPALSGNFAASTGYTATVSLTPKGGYTFEGVAADFFTHSAGGALSYTAGAEALAIDFPATGAVTGAQGISWGTLDYTAIPVQGYPADDTANPLLIRRDGAQSVTLTVTAAGWTDIEWYVDGSDTADSSGASITLAALDYSPKPHRISVFATRNGIRYSRALRFTVAAESTGPGPGGGGGEAVTKTLDQLTGYIAGLEANTADNPYKIKLADGTQAEYFSGANMETLKNALAQSRYIELDLSGVTFTGNAIPEGKNSSPTTAHFNYFILNNTYIAGLILPASVTTIGNYAFAKAMGLKSITFQNTGNTTIGQFCFTVRTIVRITIKGTLTLHELNSFPPGNAQNQAEPGGFDAYYKTATQKTGTHVWTVTGDSGSWSRLADE